VLLLRCTSLAAVASCLPALFAQQAPLVDILSDELSRNFQVLKDKGDPPPYYIAYNVTDLQSEVVTASLGAVSRFATTHDRYFDCSVRVGAPSFDNYHPIDGERPQFSRASLLPLEDRAAAIRPILWRETDRAYQSGAQRLMQVRTRTRMKSNNENDPPDFSSAPAITALVATPALKFSRDEWAARLRKLSEEFTAYSGALTSSIAVMAQREIRTLVNTDGSRIQHGRTLARITIVARGKAGDGRDLVANESFEANDPAHLPDDTALRAAIKKVGEQLSRLQRAPEADPFVGPAILSGRAAAVFFHEIFGHRIEGHRQKDESEGQTFAKRIGTPVLPAFLSVVFDPTRAKQGTTDLMGAYPYDDEGIKARKVQVVDKGVLREFLMSRSPLPDFPQSNGHGRKEPGLEPVARQSNLFVEAAQTVSEAELKKLLTKEVARQNKPYGLYFEEITGGYTTTGRRGLQAFTVIPLVVYRVYPDGRPDELVRGVDIVGTPLASFEKILAAGDKAEVFNGYCGAESGDVPVSAISPALLISEIETQRKAGSTDRPPYLPRPSESDGASR
jgi:TldD protein